MAITTLPYPSMDFVPLDILTATELDQLVANIEAINTATIQTASIANQAITGAKIADTTITSGKLAGGAVLMTRTELYSNPSGTNGNFTVSDAPTNYDYLEVTYADTNSTPNSAIKLVPSDASSFALDIAHAGGSSTVYWNIARWVISGTTFTHSSNAYQKAIASTTVSTTSTASIHIYKVVGVKFV